MQLVIYFDHVPGSNQLMDWDLVFCPTLLVGYQVVFLN
jgi:hypothetical protein